MSFNMSKRYEIIQKIIEIEIYLYIIFMFLTKGEAIRNILLFSSFFLWLASIRLNENRGILKHPVALLFWGNIASVIIASIFSIDPLYSFSSLKLDPLRAVIIFCLLATMFSDEKRIKRFVTISYFLLLFTISVGYFSYWAYDLPLMKPTTAIRHAWHSRFAVDLNTLLPFTFILFLMTKDKRSKAVFLFTMIAAISGIVLSTSRGGLAGFISILSVWLMYLLKIKKINFKFITATVLLIVALTGTSLLVSPWLRAKSTDIENIMSLTRRTEIWGPLIAAASERPVFGWGYGPDIFTMDKPFENTPFKKAPVHIKPAFRNPHNPFLRIFFHQGIPGVIMYIALLVTATITFWKGRSNTEHFVSYILVACTSILVGTYFVNAVVENSQLRDLALILGLGMAAKKLKSEDSNT